MMKEFGLDSSIDRLRLLRVVAKRAALCAGQFLEEGKGMNIVCAQGKDIKLAADLESEGIIVEILQRDNDIAILSEESGVISKDSSDKDLIWIVDPLDGTYNYYNKIPFCCVSIALWRGTAPLLGVVYDFKHREMFDGIVSGTAYLNDKPIQVSSRNQRGEAFLGTGFPVKSDYSGDQINDWAASVYKFRKARLLGSAALSLGYVASGRLDAYQEEGIMHWDVAAGLAIVAAAGGQYEVEPYKHQPNCFTVRASNGRLPFN